MSLVCVGKTSMGAAHVLVVLYLSQCRAQVKACEMPSDFPTGSTCYRSSCFTGAQGLSCETAKECTIEKCKADLIGDPICAEYPCDASQECGDHEVCIVKSDGELVCQGGHALLISTAWKAMPAKMASAHLLR